MEGSNFCFNGALNMFYLRFYDSGHVVEDYPFLLLCDLVYEPSQDSTYITFVTLVVEHLPKPEIACWIHHSGSENL